MQLVLACLAATIKKTSKYTRTMNALLLERLPCCAAAQQVGCTALLHPSERQFLLGRIHSCAHMHTATTQPRKKLLSVRATCFYG